MSETITEDELTNKNKRNFINNSIFGQKLINGLSRDKKTEVNIDYFLSHINNFYKYKNENYEDKVNYEKFIDKIPQNIQEKLKNESDITVKSRHTIEPYCKKQIKIITPINIFKKCAYHHKLVKLDSQYYDLLGMIYLNDNITGYVCCLKKNSQTSPVYKTIFIFISSKYDKNFFDKKIKKLSIINEITEDISFFEKEVYTKYLKHFRNQLFSIIFEIIQENKNIKNIVCIGDEEGGNILQLFLMDIINNINETNIKIPDEIMYYLFTNNTAMLSIESFYIDLMNNLGGNDNTIITCFDEENNSYKTWEIDEKKKTKLNFIVLNNNS